MQIYANRGSFCQHRLHLPGRGCELDLMIMLRSFVQARTFAASSEHRMELVGIAS